MSSNTPPETIAAILAEMRTYADRLDDAGAGPSPTDLRSFADRIEAAAKRERAFHQAFMDGLKLACDHLREQRDRAVQYANAAPHPGSASWKEMQAAFVAAKKRKPEENYGNAAAMREALMKARLYFDHRGEGTNLDDAGMAIDAITSIYAALSAPTRNCDRYGDAKSALDAFIREKEIKTEDVDALNLRDFFDWLFAPAKGCTE